jgi:hypothetical protein
MFEKLIDGNKQSTSRLGHRDVKIGEELLIIMTENERICYTTSVTNVKYCKFSELTEEEAKREGYNNLKELKDNLASIYNPSQDDEFTLIYFE